MKVKDLRIGNLVYGGFEDDEENSNHSVCVVTGLSEDQHLGEGWNFMLENMERKDVENYFEMKPIPLTEEWLLKFGFERGLIFKKFITKEFDINILKPYKDQKEFYFMPSANVKWGVYLKSVHQLQNLYFALCGEELELK